MLIENLGYFLWVGNQFVIYLYAIWRNGRFFTNDFIYYGPGVFEVASTCMKAFFEKLGFMTLS